MNKEIIKAMNKKATKKDTIRKWWSKNGYKVLRVVLFPIWTGIVAKDKIEGYLNSKNKWNDERANEILSYYVSRNSDWDAENKCLYFFDNGYGWSMSFAKRSLKRKDRRFWSLYSGWTGGKIRSYLINDFELEGFEKEIGCCDDGWTEITFKLIEK